MRLQRALARAGVASRRRSEDLIRAGRVYVNGEVAHIGMSVDPDRDVVTVRGKRVRPAAVRWVALHKPIGYVVTRKDPRGRPTVFQLVPDIPGLTYVGRLDVMTSGLLLMTTDGEVANRLMHPRYAVERSYRARVHGKAPDAIQQALRRPVLVDGRAVQIIRHRVRSLANGESELLLTLAEGRYRIVRRLCTQLGLKVAQLVRLTHGPVRLGRLPAGQWRDLTPREIRALGTAGAAVLS